MIFKYQILLIEGGRPLEMIRLHIAEVDRVSQQNREIAIELGVEEIYTHNENGSLTGVVFNGDIHPEFTKPKRRGNPSYPRKGSSWEKRIKELIGYRSQEEWISSELCIPRDLSFSRNGKWCGSSFMGLPFRSCGFLYLGVDGPYAMWAPDVPAYVAQATNDGRGDVDEPARSFKFDINGTRLITQDEWNLIVLQHKVEKQRAGS